MKEMTVIEKRKKNIVILKDDNSKRIGLGGGRRIRRLKVSSKPRIKPTSVWEECF